MDDIDCRIAIVPSFPGLQCFPEGRNFKQWTGDDSKALMKVRTIFSQHIHVSDFVCQVYLPALEGYVPTQMLSCFSALLDFCYLARQSSHDTNSLSAMQDALSRFRTFREVFEEVGVQPDGFSLPRQHALEHYTHGIKLFGSPNGLCSSITESKHIRTVKQPWRRSSKNNPLIQILQTNQRLDKLGAARSYFERHGMLKGTALSEAIRTSQDDGECSDIEDSEFDADATHDVGAVDSDAAHAVVEIAKKPGAVLVRSSLFLLMKFTHL